MTNGTSQGLFVVVAIVIFGIFVGLTYTLFGSEGLSNDLKGIFENGTEQANKSLKSNYLYDYYNDSKTLTVISESKDSIQFSTKQTGKAGDGVVVKSEMLEPNKTYKLSYDMTLIDGNITRIAGHILLGERITYYLDGKLVDTKGYIDGNFYSHTYSESYPNDKKIHHIEIIFDTNLTSLDEDGNLISDIFPTDSKVYIQPNRGIVGPSYEVRIDNMLLEPM